MPSNGMFHKEDHQAPQQVRRTDLKSHIDLLEGKVDELASHIAFMR